MEDKKIHAELAHRDTMLTAQAHWYKSILDAIPLPLSVTDADMNLTFVNAAAEKLFDRRSEELIGQHCRLWNVPICGTAECSITRAKQGLMQTFFKFKGVSYQVDTEIIRDLTGKTSGFLEILHDVTKVENAAQRQANEANEAKSAFLATISHEMRTPLNAILGLGKLTLDEGGLSRLAESNLETICNAGSTLQGIVNDILDLSKIKSGKFEVTPHEYDLPGMANAAIAQNLPSIGGKPIRFVLDIDENMPARLHGDELRVTQIINNLLSNAFKYTEKGTVTLGLACKREGETIWMTIRVADTGVGIRPEYHARIFSDYSQFDANANRKIAGTGLGLSITKSLVEMMGGRISVESVYGKGSVFTAEFRQRFVNDAVIGVESAGALRGLRYVASKSRRNARMRRMRLPYARVLVVDDNVINLDVAKGLMSPYGMQIDCVTGGQKAIDLIRAEKVRYDAIFMDHMMPGMDGLEAARRIREIGTEYAGNIPIIALTANAISGNEEIFLRNGFQAFVSKPINVASLDEIIRRFVRDESREPPLGRGGPETRRRRNERGRRDNRGDRNGRILHGGGKSDPHALDDNIVDGLDIANGTKQFGDGESFMQVLRSYAVNTKPLLDSIKSVDREKLAAYAITVHGIKSSSRSIGAEPVGRLAEALENAARSGDLDFILGNNPAFLESAWKLVGDIGAMLAGIAKGKSRPKKDKPDENLLSELRARCDDYDMGGVDSVMAAIAAFEYESDPGFVDWLQENVIRLNFEQIKERITAEKPPHDKKSCS